MTTDYRKLAAECRAAGLLSAAAHFDALAGVRSELADDLEAWAADRDLDDGADPDNTADLRRAAAVIRAGDVERARLTEAEAKLDAVTAEKCATCRLPIVWCTCLPARRDAEVERLRGAIRNIAAECCLCFERVPLDKLHVDVDGKRWDICIDCMAFDQVESRPNERKCGACRDGRCVDCSGWCFCAACNGDGKKETKR